MGDLPVFWHLGVTSMGKTVPSHFLPDDGPLLLLPDDVGPAAAATAAVADLFPPLPPSLAWDDRFRRAEISWRQRGVVVGLWWHQGR